MKRRTNRMGDLVRAELSDLLLREVQDPRIKLVSLTSVEVTPDMRRAAVRVSVLGDESQRLGALEALRHARGFQEHAQKVAPVWARSSIFRAPTAVDCPDRYRHTYKFHKSPYPELQHTPHRPPQRTAAEHECRPAIRSRCKEYVREIDPPTKHVGGVVG